MKYQNPQLREMLAAEYVLGTLHGRARRRFVRLLAGDPALGAEVQRWEQRLSGLNRGFVAQPPRGVVWAAIDRQINASRVSPLPAPRAAPAAGSSGMWRNWAVAATVASVALTTALWREMQRPPQVVTQTVRVEVPVPQPMPYVAFLQPGQSDAKWMVALMPEKGLLKVSSTGSFPLDAESQSLQLWVIDDAGKPHSLGMLQPTMPEMQMPMPKDMPMPKVPTLAVSMEPKGGSPTGLPTGPVIISARAQRV